jgi:hypothetical protein
MHFWEKWLWRRGAKIRRKFTRVAQAEAHRGSKGLVSGGVSRIEVKMVTLGRMVGGIIKMHRDA